MYPARGHAMMRCLDDHSHSLGLEHIIDCVCDLSRHLFLNLKALRIRLDNAGKLANTNHSATWNIRHPSLANDWCHVMFAMALESNTTQCDHFVIPFGFLEGFLQKLGGVLAITNEKLLKCAHHTRGRLY